MAGFRKARCSIDCVINIVTHVEEARSNGEMTVAVFLDIKRAYDTTSHSHVLHRISSVGIVGRALRWIAAYLRDRFAYMKTSDGDTSHHRVTAGVPQGGVLSPLLFNVVMAALSSLLPRGVHISLYADDICIWSSGKQWPALQRRLQIGLDALGTFLLQRGMDVSYEKQ